MQHSKIEWLQGGYSINPVKGLCPMDCKDNDGKSYCYARRMYLNPYYESMYSHPEIRLAQDILSQFYALKHKKPSKVFVGSTMELFGEWVKPEWWHSIMAYVKAYSEHTFIFLTKRPENLHKFQFPPNAWVGVSATNQLQAAEAFHYLKNVKATVKFISFEPLLGPMPFEYLDKHFTQAGISWVIIGAQTPASLKTMPKLGWVEEIANAAEKAKIPVFLKDNLLSCIDQYPFACKNGKYRQEFPK